MNSMHSYKRVVLITHPAYRPFRSIKNFTMYLEDRLKKEGCQIDVWTSHSYFSVRNISPVAGKFLSYLDQYIFFPLRLLAYSVFNGSDILYVYMDQALGPWIPFLSHKPHCIFVHDFAALRKSRGLFKGHRGGLKEKFVQELIASGVRWGRDFICISEKSKSDLQGLINPRRINSAIVIPNPLTQQFKIHNRNQARDKLCLSLPAKSILLLYVGTCAFNKNIPGLLNIFAKVNGVCRGRARLVMVTDSSAELMAILTDMGLFGLVDICRDVDFDHLNLLYSAADAMIMPSLFEGFGWPLIEAQACGTPVITTKESPMMDVAGGHSLLLPVLDNEERMNEWSSECSEKIVDYLLYKTEGDLIERATICRDWALRFDPNLIYSQYFRAFENIYTRQYNGRS